MLVQQNAQYKKGDSLPQWTAASRRIRDDAARRTWVAGGWRRGQRTFGCAQATFSCISIKNYTPQNNYAAIYAKKIYAKKFMQKKFDLIFFSIK